MSKKKLQDKYSDAFALLNEKPVHAEPSKLRTTLYFDRSIYAKFKKMCDRKEKTASQILEAAMVDLMKGEK